MLVTYNDSNLEIRTLDLVYGFFTPFIDLRDGLLKVTTHYHSDSKIVFDNVLLEHGGLFHLSSLLLSTFNKLGHFLTLRGIQPQGCLIRCY